MIVWCGTGDFKFVHVEMLGTRIVTRNDANRIGGGHLMRLLLISALREGELRVRLGEERDALLSIKHGERLWPDVNAWRLRLHKELDEACVKTGSAKARPRIRSDAFPELTFSHGSCYLSLVSGIHL